MNRHNDERVASYRREEKKDDIERPGKMNREETIASLSTAPTFMKKPQKLSRCRTTTFLRDIVCSDDSGFTEPL